jgi:predicted transcriptional regulator
MSELKLALHRSAFKARTKEAIESSISMQGMTRKDLAQELDMSVETLRYKIQDPGKLTVSEFLTVCEKLNINPQYLTKNGK